MLAELVSKLVCRFDALKGTGSIVRLDHAFSALTSDVLGRLCCGGAKGDLLDESEIPFEFVPHSYVCIDLKMMDIANSVSP